MRLLACAYVLLVGLTLVGCRPLMSYLANQASSACAEDKIAFTQETGCQNDGSFEFCIPTNDPAALAQVLEVAPDSTCIASRGRAGCDTATQLLCMLSTDDMCHPEQPDAMSSAGWQTTCEMADLSFVDRIVPTWYE